MIKQNIVIFLSLISLVACSSSRQTSTAVATLNNTYWRLTEINGKTVTTQLDHREVHMIFTRNDDQQQLKGFAGCNTMGGTYTVQDNAIKFNVISTRMMCIDTMDIENAFLNALNITDRFKIEGEHLLLFNKKNISAKFESVYF